MNRIDEIKEVRESVMRIKLMSGMSGVIDLIDELMSEAERLTAELQQRENDQINAEMNLEHQSAEIDRLTAERDAAVKDLKHNDNCDICAHGQTDLDCYFECEGCNECACGKCRDDDKWEWRGPCAENTEGSERCETD